MNYRSVAGLNRDIVGWLPRLPRDLDAVVGVPRSGLLAAGLVALHLDLPLTDVDGLLAGRTFGGGARLGGARGGEGFLAAGRRVLVLDDSLHTGAAMDEVRRRIAAAGLPHLIRYAAVYVVPGKDRAVDFYCRTLRAPRFFEWNLANHAGLRQACMDVDGVLCRDPTQRENDDGAGYERFLREAEPILRPKETVGWLVTCRLEKYRAQTEAWLARHNVRYGKLIMMDLPDKASRLAAGSHAAFKARVYGRVPARVFVESSARQAAEIARLSGKDVLCWETRELVRPESLPALCRAGGYAAGRLLRHPFRTARRAGGAARRRLVDTLKRLRITACGLGGGS